MAAILFKAIAVVLRVTKTSNGDGTSRDDLSHYFEVHVCGHTLHEGGLEDPEYLSGTLRSSKESSVGKRYSAEAPACETRSKRDK